jgi:hypothetical protein
MSVSYIHKDINLEYDSQETLMLNSGSKQSMYILIESLEGIL